MSSNWPCATATLLISMLEHEGYRCATASSADEAMAMLDEHEYAVALVDIMMPGDSGLELVERHGSFDPDSPFEGSAGEWRMISVMRRS